MSDPWKVHQTLVGFDKGGDLWSVDTIEYAGAFWLVPEWIEDLTQGYRTPVRLISIVNLPKQDMPDDWAQKFVLNEPMHKDVFDGRPSTLAHRYIVLEAPQQVRYPLPAERLN